MASRDSPQAITATQPRSWSGAGGGERRERPAVAAAGQQRAGERVDHDAAPDQRQRPRTRGRRFAQQLAEASYGAPFHRTKP